ncbi:bifunctional 2',3'-cyclic-nucleotide 2'-phosphodiesterase/3'-nucleotidase [Allosediminivita pacifica]|uniref:2',3'-cyclic-nucleotide 2'-phosphodiesterase/3'-nucleotidase n=1 Tax=Allosediminivita pacifica TaxID=1267769 RepID=A0A2T6AZN1_9RHOB|nr:bifunctional 2',3'-cyclic-nucleotide 2'-phosphodiesterase/3'-nucleotidase [Allosediminivita pacifica]PTX49278.1 2',3'-cyclic-nucleotide 2'-phosphodiesterase/3'-nucleotidase [Allosediminivita pacifica]GGB05312.1 2',3'-cyclic-nucleotide 2'-phosphodiesterase [Allosediminivita pacifica]
MPTKRTETPAPETAFPLARLRLIATSDLHAQIWPHDYFRDRPCPGRGLAPLGTLIRELRAAAPNSLLLDNGDCLQGTPMADIAAFDPRDGPHPVIAAMNALGYDAATLGNHEFNYGLPALQAAVAGARHPVVLANLHRHGTPPEADDPIFPPFTLLDRTLTDEAGRPRPIRIGLLGLTTPQVMVWDAKHLSGRVEARDILDSARHWVPRLREAGAEIVIALCHSGIDDADPCPGMENAALHLAALPGIDAIITGHAHRLFPGESYAGTAGADPQKGTLRGIPSVMPGFNARHAGVIDLLLDQTPQGWTVRDHDTRLAAVSDATPDDPEVLSACRAEHERTIDHIRRPIGHSSAPLHSFFALLGESPAIRVVQEAQRGFAEAQLRGTAHEGLPIVSSAAPFRAGGLGGPDNYCDIPAGDLCLRHAADLYEYPNLLRILRLTGADLREWLERSAAIYHRIAPGSRDAIMLDPDARPYHFDMLDGLRFDIDLSQPSRYSPEGALIDPDARRIRDLHHGTTPLDDAAQFLVVTNDYRGAGGGGFPGCHEDNIVFASDLANREVLIRHLADHDPGTTIGLRADWGFVSMPGTTAIFETGPDAAPHAEALPGRRIEPAGLSEAGFARYRLLL